MRTLLVAAAIAGALTACSESAETPVSSPESVVSSTTSVAPSTTIEPSTTTEPERVGPGGYGFDRSDPASGVANIMEAFATDEATARCIFDAWGDVANVPPAELTPELMTFNVCGTSILQLMTGVAGPTDES